MAKQDSPRAGRLSKTQVRAHRRVRQHRRRRLFRAGIFIAIALVAILLIIGLFAPSLPISFGGSSSTGGDSGQRVPGVRGGVGNLHIEVGETAKDLYTSVPATSGWHYAAFGVAPARWGVHDDVLADEVLVHNLEHGGVGIHYNCPEGCEVLVKDLKAITESYSSSSDPRSRKVIMSPYPGMDTKIVLTAWTYIDQFEDMDKSRIIQFISDHVSSSVAPEWQAR